MVGLLDGKATAEMSVGEDPDPFFTCLLLKMIPLWKMAVGTGHFYCSVHLKKCITLIVFFFDNILYSCLILKKCIALILFICCCVFLTIFCTFI